MIFITWAVLPNSQVKLTMTENKLERRLGRAPSATKCGPDGSYISISAENKSTFVQYKLRTVIREPKASGAINLDRMVH